MNHQKIVDNLNNMLDGTANSAEQIKRNVASTQGMLEEVLSCDGISNEDRQQIIVAQANISNIMKHAKDGNLDALNKIKDQVINGSRNNK